VSKVRIEWVILGPTPSAQAAPTLLVQKVVGNAVVVEATASATAPQSRPAAPAGATYARVTFLTGSTIVDFGTDPTAAQDRGVLYSEGMIDAFPIAEGTKFSFVEYVQ